MTKVCHLTTVHPIDDMRIMQECTSLAAFGYNVILIACGEAEFEDIKDGVKRISLFIPVKNRIHRMYKRTKIIYEKALELDATVYHFHDPELLPIGNRLKKKGKKVIFDSHEHTAVLIKSRKWLPSIFRNMISILYLLYENKIARNFDAVITVTPLIVNRFKKINPNTYQITNFPVFDKSLTRKITECKDLCFAGNITPAYMLENVISAISQTSGATLIIAGRPVSNNYLDELKKNNGWLKVNYLGKISQEDVKDIYKKTLIGIACLGYVPNVGFKEGSLGVIKLFEYMNYGLAVICTDSIIWSQIIKKENCGICVNPYDVNEITNAMQYLIDNPLIAYNMGNNGRNAIERVYNWKSQEKILLEIYKKILS